jgi:hypothetical protein
MTTDPEFMKACAMYLDSELGNRRELDLMETELGGLIRVWAVSSLAAPFEPGCAEWEAKQLRNEPRHVGDSWAWINLVSVMYCSMDCALTGAAYHKTVYYKEPYNACDVCHAAEGVPHVCTLGGIMVAMITCADCAGFPEAKATQN